MGWMWWTASCRSTASCACASSTESPSNAVVGVLQLEPGAWSPERTPYMKKGRRSAPRRQKYGVLQQAPHKSLQKNYRFFAAFFLAPLAAFFAICASPSELATQASDDRLVVTTGGLSHPPSYQM